MFDILDSEFATETIANLVIPPLLLYGDEKSECVVCLSDVIAMSRKQQKKYLLLNNKLFLLY